MKIQTDCLPCMLNMAVGAMKRLGLEEGEARELTRRVLALPGFQGDDWELTSPEIIERIMREFYSYLGDPDPFRAVKSQMNQRALALLPSLTEHVAASQAPLETAARLAIVGNAIDFMVPEDKLDLDRVIASELETPLPVNTAEELERRVTAAETIVIIGDNAGEIVFDHLMIGEIRKITSAELIYVVRRFPTMNDAALLEAREAGLDRVARVVENGIDGPLPGVLLDRCSASVRRWIMEADLVISKGGGNFDTLHEDLSRMGPVTFMLLSKCRPYKNLFHTEIGRPILSHF